MSQDVTHSRWHQLLSHIVLVLLVGGAVWLVDQLPHQLGWRRFAMPAALFGWAFCLWATVAAAFWIRRGPRQSAARFFVPPTDQATAQADQDAKRQDRLPAGFHPYTVRLYSAWFILCTAYGGWIIWGYPDDVGTLSAIVQQSANRPPIADINTRPGLTFLGTAHPFEHGPYPADAADNVAHTIAQVAMEPMISTLAAVPAALRLWSEKWRYQPGLFPDPNDPLGKWLSGMDKQTVLTTLVPAVMVFLFAFPTTMAHLLRPDVKRRNDWLREIADDTYFLGFLLTLAGLSSALLGIKPGADNLLVALGKAGGAISTTFVAVVMRVLVLDVVNLGHKKDTDDDDTSSGTTPKGMLAEVKSLLSAVAGKTAACPMLGRDCASCVAPCAIGRTHDAVLDLRRRHDALNGAAPSGLDRSGDLAGQMSRSTGEILGKLAEIRGEVLGEIRKGPSADGRLDDLTRMLRECCASLRQELEQRETPAACPPELPALLARLTAIADDLTTRPPDDAPSLSPRLDRLERNLAQLVEQGAAAAQACQPGPDHAGRAAAALAPLRDHLARLDSHLQALADTVARQGEQQTATLAATLAELRQDMAAAQSAAPATGECGATLADIARRLAALEDRLDAPAPDHGDDIAQALRHLAGQVDALRRSMETPPRPDSPPAQPQTAQPQTAQPQTAQPQTAPIHRAESLTPSGDDVVQRVARSVMRGYSGLSRHGA